MASANEGEAKRQGMQIVLKEGYSVSAPDLSSLVTKLRAARPDVLFHTGYNPDINLLLRQSKEQGFRVKAYIGTAPATASSTSSRRRSGTTSRASIRSTRRRPS